MSVVREVAIPKPESRKLGELIYGLIPSQNEHALRIIYPVILPGLEYLHKRSNDWWTPYGVRTAIFNGQLELSMAYFVKSNSIVPDDQYQQFFAEKLKTPFEDYVGFYVIQYFPHVLNIYLAYCEPKYMTTNVRDLGIAHLEKHARSLKLPRVQLSTLQENGAPCISENTMEAKGYSHAGTNWVKHLKGD